MRKYFLSQSMLRKFVAHYIRENHPGADYVYEFSKLKFLPIYILERLEIL
jgi:hypothetical protein